MKKNLRELKDEEPITGWFVGVQFQNNNRDGYTTIEVETKERAEKVACSMAFDGTFKPEKDEKLVIIDDISSIVKVEIYPITRTIYVE